MTKTEKRIEFMRRYSTFLLLAANEGIKLLPYSWHRTDEEQYRLYMEGKSKCDGKKKRSLHQDRLAIDNAVMNADGSLEWNGADARYGRLDEIADFVGLETGFKWHHKDSVHIQWRKL